MYAGKSWQYTRLMLDVYAMLLDKLFSDHFPTYGQWSEKAMVLHIEMFITGSKTNVDVANT